MSRLLLVAGVCAVAAVFAVALAARDDSRSDPTRSDPTARGSDPTAVARARKLVDSPPPLTSGRLARVPDSGAARKRVAYADPKRLAAARLPAGLVDPDAALEDGENRRLPEVNAIAAQAQSAAQSCLGESFVEVILGPGTVGNDAALGVGIAEKVNEPTGHELRICGAPHFIRDIHATEKRLEARFPTAEVGENEIGEREIVYARVPLEDLDEDEVAELMKAGSALRELAWK